jgi:glyoxylase I family protein
MALVQLGAHGVDLFQHDGNGGERFEPGRTGLDHLGLAVDSYDDLQAWAEWLDAHDVPRSDIRDLGTAAIFDFADPDGIQLEFSSWNRTSCVDPPPSRRKPAPDLGCLYHRRQLDSTYLPGQRVRTWLKRTGLQGVCAATPLDTMGASV